MGLIKINKPKKKIEKRFSELGLERMRQSSRDHMIMNNPMKREDVKLNVSMKKKGISTSPKTHFKKGNELYKLRKKKKISKLQKIEMSLIRKGKKIHSEETKKMLSEKMKERLRIKNPMKDPVVVKKMVETLKKYHEKKKRNTRIKNNLKRINKYMGVGKRNKKVREKIICRLYEDGLDTIQISGKIGMSVGGVLHILERNNVPRRIGRWSGKSCPNAKSEFVRTILSERMKINNPMKDPVVVKKMVETLKKNKLKNEKLIAC